jgi:ribosomal protein L7/L12
MSGSRKGDKVKLFGMVELKWLGTKAQQHERAVKDLIVTDGLIQAIKFRRQVTGEGLKEAYVYIKKVRDKYGLEAQFTK